MLAVDNRAADIRASTATTTIYDLYAAVPDRSSQLPLPLTLGSESRSDNDAPVRDMTTSSASDDHVLHAREEEPHSVPSSSARHATGASASASSSAISLSMHTQSVSGASASAPSSAQRASFTNKPSTSANGAHDSSSHAQQHLKRRDQRLSAPTHPMSSSVTVQSPGEDDEAFQVRSTYARLEVSGVYGDGYDDGIERTRERSHVNLLKANHQQQRRSVGDDDGELDSQEKAVLAKVDRYGFFDQASKAKNEARVNVLEASAFKTVPKLPRRPKTKKTTGSSKATSSGSITSVDPADIERLVDAVQDKSRRKELERVDKWQRMLSPMERDAGGNIIRWKWDPAGKGRKLHERVYKGIPDRWRMAAWAAMVESRSQQSQHALTGGSGEGPSRSHAQRPPPPSPAALDAEFRRAMDVPSSYDVQIDLDIPRTISGHVMFRTRYGYGQRSLFHVLHCFSMYCDTCGYCQGMGPIAATLLCYFDAAQVYRSMVRLHDTYGMHDVFRPGFPGLLESLYVQELLVKHLMPEVYESLKKNMVSSSSWATKHYITLFATSVPFKTQLRLWDALLLDGPDVLILGCIAIIWASRHILADPRADFESILSALSGFHIVQDEDAMCRWMRKVLEQPEVKMRIHGWRQEWRAGKKDAPDALI